MIQRFPISRWPEVSNSSWTLFLEEHFLSGKKYFWSISLTQKSHLYSTPSFILWHFFWIIHGSALDSLSPDAKLRGNFFFFQSRLSKIRMYWWAAILKKCLFFSLQFSLKIFNLLRTACRLWGDLIEAFLSLKGTCTKDGERLVVQIMAGQGGMALK